MTLKKKKEEDLPHFFLVIPPLLLNWVIWVVIYQIIQDMIQLCYRMCPFKSHHVAGSWGHAAQRWLHTYVLFLLWLDVFRFILSLFSYRNLEWFSSLNIMSQLKLQRASSWHLNVTSLLVFSVCSNCHFHPAHPAFCSILCLPFHLCTSPPPSQHFFQLPRLLPFTTCLVLLRHILQHFQMFT